MEAGYPIRKIDRGPELDPVYEISGPGLGRYHLPIALSEFEAENMSRWLALAFLAGSEYRAEEIRKVLGVRI